MAIVQSPPILYSDFRTDFMASPVNGDLLLVVNDKAVIQSVSNLLQTDFYERQDPTIGSQIRGLLFELPSMITNDALQKEVKNCIQNFEPRAAIISVEVAFRPDQNAYHVKVVFSCQNTGGPVTLNKLLSRDR